MLIGKVFHLKVIQKILGHSMLSTIADVCGQLFPQIFMQAAEVTERALGTGLYGVCRGPRKVELLVRFASWTTHDQTQI